MKKISVILLSLVMGMMLTVNAQAPYRHSIGVTLGNMEAFSYKTFLTDNFALSVDAGFKWTFAATRYGSGISMSIEANPNFMYEAATGVDGLHWLAGGGLSLGMALPQVIGGSVAGKFGINAIGGVEYKFKIPLTLQADFRPGYGLLFNDDYGASYFDWGICVGVRYTIK
ncbi:MAG: hypothetical protein J6X16_07720 [Bacteroidales bacterium]|nr:hypothetical protein [Bacteroidales bacterium]